MILDSDVIIEVLRGNPATIAWLRARRAAGVPLRYSPVSRAEIRAGSRGSERAAIAAFFGSLTALAIEASTGEIAGEQLAKFAPSHGVQLGDALIAGAALERSDDLATFNTRHFPGVTRTVRPDR
ncbi:MAG TPA: PIN domain-containing protein [Candidatus Nitrosotalea sp.]|nr:PIN domain-containing protein [Candidatus Nitrosotalea sp.]